MSLRGNVIVLVPMLLVSGLFFSGCASMYIQIPSPEGSAVYADQKGESGFLDLMIMSKTAYDERYAYNPPIMFTFLVRTDEKGARWEALKSGGTNRRSSLPVGRYVVRAIVENDAYIKDMPVTIESGKHTLIFYYGEGLNIKNPKAQHRGVIDISVFGGSVSVPYFTDIQDYSPRSHDEEDLLRSLVDSDWRVRAHVVLLLGQFGTKKALPALKNLKDDVVIKVIAGRAIDRIEGPRQTYTRGGYGR